MDFCRASAGRNPRAACVLTPQARPNSPVGSAEKHCAAQAEYGRLAAQAYSPSDAMSQARFCLDGIKKVQRVGTNLPGHLPAETGRYGGRICSRGRGWSSRFSPPSATPLHSPMRRGRWAGRPATSLPCRRNACRYRADVNAGLDALRLRGHAHLNLVDLSAESRMQEAAASCLPAPTPGALDKAAAAAYGALRARPAGPAAAPARAPGCG
jgi:hypothetical protein